MGALVRAMALRRVRSGQAGAGLWVRQEVVLQGCEHHVTGLQALRCRVVSSTLQGCKLYYRVASSTLQGCKLYLAGL